MREQETVLKSGNTVQEDYLKKAEGNYSKQKTESLKTSQIEEINRLDRGLLPKWLRSGARKETIKSLREKVDKTRRTSGGGKGKKNKDKSPEEIEKEAREWVEEGRLDDLKEAIAKVE